MATCEGGRKTDTPGFSRLVELLSSSYLLNGVPKNTALKLEEAEARLQSVKRSYLELSVIHSELRSIMTTSHSQSNKRGSHGRKGGIERGVLAAAEAQHCLRLHPEASLLGLSLDHLRLAGGRPLTGAVKEEVLREMEERLKAKCLRVVQWHSEGRIIGSESLQLAKAAQLPSLLVQQINKLESAEEQLREKRMENSRYQYQRHEILVETSQMLTMALEQVRLGSVAKTEQIKLDYLQAQCNALLGKQDVMYYQLLKGVCSDDRLQALQHIKLHLTARMKAMEEQLSQTQYTLQHYLSLGPELTSLAQQYATVQAEIENKQWALTELQKSSSQTNN